MCISQSPILNNFDDDERDQWPLIDLLVPPQVKIAYVISKVYTLYMNKIKRQSQIQSKIKIYESVFHEDDECYRKEDTRKHVLFSCHVFLL